MSRGDTLCKTIVHTRDGRNIEEYHLEPSMVSVSHHMAYRAITSGFLVANSDALIDDNPQTWRAIANNAATA
jgi:N-acetylglucosamine kinase-like BadF-type ATPase